MEINEPLHGQIHLWMIAAVVILGYLTVVVNKYLVSKHEENRKATAVPCQTVAQGSCFLCDSA